MWLYRFVEHKNTLEKYFYTCITSVATKDTYTKDVHGKISDSASEGQIISAFLNKSIDI